MADAKSPMTALEKEAMSVAAQADQYVDKAKTNEQVQAAEKAVSAWRVHGWAAVALMVLANVVGVFFHV